jgi:hypothetical protein
MGNQSALPTDNLLDGYMVENCTAVAHRGIFQIGKKKANFLGIICDWRLTHAYETQMGILAQFSEK